MRHLLILLALLAAPLPARAVEANLSRGTDGYLYFNRPGADFATHDSELKNCVETWRGGVVFGKPGLGVVGGVVGGAIEAGVQGMMINGWERARQKVNIEHCMVVRGWRLMRLPKAEGERLAALDSVQLRSALEPMIGAEKPTGDVARVWRNEASWIANLINRDAQGSRQTMLSTLAMNPAPDPAQKVEVIPGAWTIQPSQIAALRDTEIGILPPGMALVIVRLTGPSKYKGYGVSFQRSQGTPAGDVEAFTPQLIKIPKINGRYDLTVGYLVPAGTWSLYGQGMFHFCLGAPGFTVVPGDVVYLGGFDYGGERLQPDMSMAPAQAYLAKMPDLAAKLRPADWTNGHVTPCRSWYPYAMEFDGFSHRAGYVWGSAAAR